MLMRGVANLALAALTLISGAVCDEKQAKEAAAAGRAVPKSADVIEVADRHQYAAVVAGHDAVLLELYANWCAACHALAPELDAVAAAARTRHPRVAVARANVAEVEYLATSFMVGALPDLVFLRRPAPAATPEVRRVSANFTADDLLAYIAGGWTADAPVGGYATLWCTPANLCGHLGGLFGDLVVEVDRRFNPFDIPPWTFMAIVISATYLVGQVGVTLLARALARKYRSMARARAATKDTTKDAAASAAKDTDAAGPSTPRRSARQRAKKNQ
ncbi:hypothetical protein H4R18_001333 [Coemansia javaensis]|uniref:Thioredoxin domain-containing protein n=1 Tax=Coemansia javaensis TaxID=2761396 RepID=A0A9W8HFJ9_9FUNG|nr:hypothetical protein H4R18_001333 [Coemansia javaensis]